jgi:hypothetical protein
MIQGSCHCGSVHWSLDVVPDEATACNCTVCRRYGALWAYGFENQDIRISGDTRTYAWGDRDLGFHFCANCGCIVAWWATEEGADGRRYGAVNLRLAEPDSVGAIPIRRHEGFETGKDLPRDGRRIADVWF